MMTLELSNTMKVDKPLNNETKRNQTKLYILDKRNIINGNNPLLTDYIYIIKKSASLSSSSSCHAAGTDIPDPLLPTSPYHSSPPVGLQGHIPYPHIAAG